MSGFWAAVLTKRGNEALAFDNAQRQGFRTYLPKIDARPLGSKRPIIKPLFPRFIFVQQDDLFETSWITLKYTKGCCGPIIGAGDQPGIIRQSDIDRMQDQERQGVIALPIRFVPGQSLRVKAQDHALHNHLVVYQGMSGKDRAVILSHLFSSSLSTIPLECLEAA